MMKAPAQCCGFAGSGKRCSITAGSRVKDRCGRRATQSLEHGAPYCLYHVELFRPTELVVESRIFYLDFETTGLDLGLNSIVEIGLLEDADACFQTVVRPPAFGDDGTAVHGISNTELAEGPDLVEAFSRMTSFVEALLAVSVDPSGTHAHRGRSPRGIDCVS